MYICIMLDWKQIQSGNNLSVDVSLRYCLDICLSLLSINWVRLHFFFLCGYIPVDEIIYVWLGAFNIPNFIRIGNILPYHTQSYRKFRIYRPSRLYIWAPDATNYWRQKMIILLLFRRLPLKCFSVFFSSWLNGRDRAFL